MVEYNFGTHALHNDGEHGARGVLPGVYRFMFID
jgi:hypothetical protein